MKSYVKEFMEAKGVSYRVLFKNTGVTQPTIRNAITKPQKLKVETLCRLADYFGVCVKDLFDDGCG